MLSKSIVVLVLAVAYASAVEKRDAPVANSDVTDVISKAEESIKQAGEHISKMLGLEGSGEHVVELIKNHSKTFATHAETVQKQLETGIQELKNSTLAAAFQDITMKIQDAIGKLKEEVQSSNVSETAVALQDNFQKGLSAIVEEGKRLISNLEPEVIEAGKKLETLTKSFIDEAVESMNQLQDKVHTATKHDSQPGHH